jgi:15-cis-phytoene synthase
MPKHLDQLETSYRFCATVTGQSGSSFTPAFRLVDPRRRRAMETLYAFTRHTDDLADSSDPVDSRRAALAQWREALEKRVPATPEYRSDPLWIFPALRETIDRYSIPIEHLRAVIDGVELDLVPGRFATFEASADYCHKVASAVGLACIHIWGFSDPRALDLARQCGLAFQWTNILRDLKEDIADGRLYLPLQDLREAGYEESQLAASVDNGAFRRLIQIELERAKAFYHEGAELINYLNRPGRRIFGMMMSVYWRLLRQIENDPGQIFHERIRLGRSTLVRQGLRWALLPTRRNALP